MRDTKLIKLSGAFEGIIHISSPDSVLFTDWRGCKKFHLSGAARQTVHEPEPVPLHSDSAGEKKQFIET